MNSEDDPKKMKLNHWFKYLLLLVTFLSIIVSTSAQPADGLGYWNFESGSGTTLVDQWGTTNLTLTGTVTWDASVPTFNISGSGGNYSNRFDGSTGYDTDGNNLGFGTGEEISICAWINPDTIADKDIVLKLHNYHFGMRSGGKVTFAYYPGTDQVYQSTATPINASIWQFICTTYTFATGSSAKVYYNAVEEPGTWAFGSGNVAPPSNSNPFNIVTNSGYLGSYYDGLVDEVYIFNTTLTLTNISNLYNYGDINGPAPADFNFSIMASDAYDSSTINNFSVAYNISALTPNSTTSNSCKSGTCTYKNYSDIGVVAYFEDTGEKILNTNCEIGPLRTETYVPGFGISTFSCWNGTEYEGIISSVFTGNVMDGTYASTTNGSINTNIDNNDDDIIEIEFYDAINSKGYFFNQTYPSVNVSSDYEGLLAQAYITLEALSKVSNTTITSQGDFWINNVNITQGRNISAGSYNVTFNSSAYDWYSKTQEIDVEPVTNNSYNVTELFNNLLNITANNFTGGEVISNFTGLINTTGFQELINSTPNEYYLFEGEQNISYTVYVTHPDYANNSASNTQTILPLNVTSTLNFLLKRSNSILITARDVLTNALLNNVNTTLYGTSFNQTYTFNESLFLFGLNATTYDYLATVSGYSQITGVTEVIQNGFTELYLYFTSEATDTKIFVKNRYDQFLSDAEVLIIRNYDGTVVASGTTDIAGEVSFFLDRTLTYTINITREGYQNFTGTLNAIEPEYTFTLVDLSTEEPSRFQGINITFSPSGSTLNNNTLYNFSYSYNNSGAYDVDACYLQLINDFGELALINNASCTSTTGNIFIETNSSNGTYVELRAILELNGTNISYKKLYANVDIFIGDYSLHKFLSNAINRLGAGNSGLGNSGLTTTVVNFLLMIVITGIAIYSYTNIDNEAELRTSLIVTILIIISNIFGFLSTNMPNTSSFINQYGLSLLMGLITTGFFINIQVRK